jgi:hypothetical protein
MKKTSLLITMLLLIGVASFAQEKAFVSLGANLSQVDSIGTPGIGYQIGLSLQSEVTRKFSCWTEMYYMRQSGNTPSGNINSGSYNIAFSGNYYISNFHFGAGALVGLNIHSKLRDTELAKEDIAGRASVISNIGYRISKFDIVARYDYKIVGSSQFTRTYLLGVNYKITK